MIYFASPVHVVVGHSSACLVRSELTSGVLTNRSNSRSDIIQKGLLISNNHSGSTDSHPGNQCFRIPVAPFIENIASYEGAGSSETSSAVHGNSFSSADVGVSYLNELGNYRVARITAIGKLKLVDFDIVTFEFSCVVEHVIQSDDAPNVALIKGMQELTWCLTAVRCGEAMRDWT